MDEDKAALVGGHGDGADLVGAEGHVELFVGDGFVGLCVEDADVELLGVGGRG